MTVVIDDIALSALFYDPSGPIATHVKEVAEVDVLTLAKAYISRPWPGGRGPFPPPGPPYRRRLDKVSPDLHDSLTVVVAVGPQGPEADIVPTAIKRGWNYGDILKGRGYRFLPDYFYV